MKKLIVVGIAACSLMSAGASPVAVVGEMEYETLDAAVAAGGEIRLVANATVECLQIGSGVTVVLDLAGHTLTGTRTDRATIYVNGGSLTIDDSVGGGRITHDGAVTYDKHVASEATAVSVYDSGEFLFLNGTICDCEGDKATIANYGKFYMSGGSISNCTGTVCGGVQNSGDFVMAGGLITRCYSTAKSWIVFAVCSLTIVDGTIDDCGEKTFGGSRRADTIVIMGGRFAESYNQERLIRKVATREADGAWTVSLDIDTSVEDYIDLSSAMSAIAEQLDTVSGAEPAAPLHLVLPAATLTKGLYYRIEECEDVGSEWKMVGCWLATGRDLSYSLYGSDCKSRFFRVCQSLIMINWE